MHPAASTDYPASHPKLAEGQQIGGCFTLKRELFRTSRVAVWAAQDEVLGKEVSLHFLPSAVVQDSRAMTELRQEVKRNRQLIHPNILRVYDLVEDHDVAAVAMDRFEGESLRDRLGRGVIDPAELKPLITQIGETLGDAHRIQLFHRDLAPDNIFVRPNGAVLVANFGLSRVLGEALERAGQIKGEQAHLAYMSPQQIDGERPAAADDVYGLGALAFELLTGKPPFSGENLVAAIRKSAPPAISAARAAANLSNVPEEWERFVAAALAKNADQRPKSCGEALHSLSAGKPAERAPVPPIAKPAPADSATSKAKLDPVVKTSEPPKTSITTGPAKEPASAAPLPPGPPAPPPGAKPKNPVPTLSPTYPDLDRPKSKMPIIGLGIAASVLAAALYFKSGGDPNNGLGSGVSRVEDVGASSNVAPNEPPAGAGEIAAADSQENGSIAAPGNPASPGSGESEAIAGSSTGSEAQEQPTGTAIAAAEPKPGGLIGANPDAKPAPRTVTPTRDAEPKEDPTAAAAPARTAGGIAPIPVPPPPATPAKATIPKDATPEQLAQWLQERQTAIEKVAEAAAAAEKVQVANEQLKELRSEDLDGQKKMLEEKRKTLTPVIKAATEMETERKKLEENMAKTEAAAREAARAAESAKKAYEELLATSGEKVAARNKAESELNSVNQAVNEGVRQVEELTQAASKAEAQRQQMVQAKRQLEQDVQTLTAALEKATKAQREAMIKQNKPKITALEGQIKDVDEQLERYQKAVASLEALNDDSTKDAIQRIREKMDAANAQKAGFQEEIKRLSGADLIKKATAPSAAPASSPTRSSGAAVTPDPLPSPAPEASTPQAPTIASRPPQPMPETRTEEQPAPAATAEPGAGGSPNSLGMKFAPVGDVHFSVHLVTRRNFEVFSKSANLKPEHWRSPGFEQTPDHPVVNVTWKEADAFCKWLTDKERKSGFLKSHEYYRLPTDSEWSKAVGLNAESGATPEDRDMVVDDVYPWGKQWPPPQGAGNYAGEETVTELPIEGYNDKFPHTSPVGSFKANALGLYDMGGNVWQWVQDSYDGSGPARTLRGGSWYNGAIKMSLLSSCRIKSAPDTINDTYGFRIAKAFDGKARR